MELPGDAEKANIRQGLLLGEATSRSAFPAYFALYEKTFCPPYWSTAVQIDRPAFTKHSDVLDCARKLRRDPTLTREQLGNTLSLNGTIPQGEKDKAIESVLRVTFMLDCSRKYAENFKIGDYSPTEWKTTESLTSYIERAIPGKSRGFNVHKHMSSLKAWKLKKRYHFQFRPTSNIAEHLLYDSSTRTLHIFHHTAYLQAHLRRSKNKPIDQTAADSLESGTLPPQFLLETLYTIHSVLFPISTDPRSFRLLRRLIQRDDFDPDADWVEPYIKSGVPADLTYEYWNARLEQLYNVVKSHPPRNRLVSWVERHTSERNALTVAILGLFLSALFGFLACVIAGAQLIVSIFTWKYPREPS